MIRSSRNLLAALALAGSSCVVPSASENTSALTSLSEAPVRKVPPSVIEELYLQTMNRGECSFIEEETRCMKQDWTYNGKILRQATLAPIGNRGYEMTFSITYNGNSLGATSRNSFLYFEFKTREGYFSGDTPDCYFNSWNPETYGDMCLLEEEVIQEGRNRLSDVLLLFGYRDI